MGHIPQHRICRPHPDLQMQMRVERITTVANSPQTLTAANRLTDLNCGSLL